MRLWDRTAIRAFFVPGGVLVLGVAFLVYSGWLTIAAPAINFLYYCSIFGGMLLAWRFHSSRSFLSLILILIAQQAAVSTLGGPHFLTTLRVVSILLPVNFVLIAFMHERGFNLEAVAPVCIFLSVETLAGAVILGGASGGRPSALVSARHAPQPVPLSHYAGYLFAAAMVLLLLRFFYTRKPLDSAFVWSLFAIALAMRNQETVATSMLYWTAAAAVVAVSIVENSYLLAYHDELTGLPSRRAFNEATLRLRHPYSVAVVDIDHFKRFNDTFGHDTGDQVLRLVASNLAQVSAGGQAYRCGGEEFNILFPGKSVGEVVDSLEHLRQRIEKSEFRLRGNDRRQLPRGAERRSQRSRRSSKADVIRQLTREKDTAALSVTVSIGVANSSERSVFEAVVKAADKALYKAKENGRNRLETALPIFRSSRSKAAGIA